MVARSPRQPDDRELVERARAGHRDAFGELVRRHSGLAIGVATRMLRDSDAAEDAAQEAFVRAWRSLDGFRGDARFTTWLYRIVTTTCLQVIRRRRPVDGGPIDDLHAAGPGPEELAVAGDLRARVDDAVQQLSPGDRAAFVLRTFEGLSYEEVGDTLDISVAAVRSRLRRARGAVAEHLGAES